MANEIRPDNGKNTVYHQRLLDRTIEGLLTDLPAIQIMGPRAVGKTTTAMRFARSVVRLDRPGEAEVFRSDPDAALRDLAEPVLLDEWQEVPAVLPAIKRAVDENRRPGRFIVTGSVRAVLEAATWAGTGRVINVRMHPLVERELRGLAPRPSFFDRVAHGEHLEAPRAGLDLRDYVELAVRGGFPDAVASRSRPSGRRWLASYLDQVVTRDAELVEGGRDPDRLSRYLYAVAANTAGVVNEKLLYDAAGITRSTALAYEQLLRNLFIVDAVPAWTSNRIKRLMLRPKRYLVDSGLAAAMLRADVSDVMRDGDLLGRLLDTFVAAQLRPEAEVAERRPQLFHLRDQGGRHEVDLLADTGTRGIIAIEVKASSAPTSSAARHLAWLRDELGDRFLAGIVFHTGPAPFELADGIAALPISAIWS